MSGGIAAGCYGDLIMCLYQQVKPYEQNPGETDRIRSQVEKKLCESIRRHRNGRHIREKITGMPAKYFEGTGETREEKESRHHR